MTTDSERVKKFYIYTKDKDKSIQASVCYYRLHKDEVNNARRAQYKNDPVHRQKCIDRALKSQAIKRELAGRVKTVKIKCDCGQMLHEMNMKKHIMTKSHNIKMAYIDYKEDKTQSPC